MRTVAGIAVAALLLLMQAGCYRTTYMNLGRPDLPLRAEGASQQRYQDTSGWRHFWVYGWFPPEMVIPADEICGGTDRVQEIHTEQTFAQGVIGALAGYYVNIYWPYTGKVICTNEYRR